MASHDITKIVEEILSLGGTEAQITKAGPRVVKYGDQWEAQNRASESAVHALRDRLAAATNKAQTAANIIAKIRTGSVLYTQTAHGQWLVWGRDDIVVPGDTVTVTRKDGTTNRVTITTVGPVREKDGLRYRTAEFRAPRHLTEVDPMADYATSAAAEADRIGRSYGVGGQIWDNA